MTSWSQQLKACHLIFLRTSTYSQRIFFGGKSPALSKADDRIRTIPFVTGRPTFNEAKRVHRMLMAVECFGEAAALAKLIEIAPSHDRRVLQTWHNAQLEVRAGPGTAGAPVIFCVEGNQNFDYVEGNQNFDCVEGNQNFDFVEGNQEF